MYNLHGYHALGKDVSLMRRFALRLTVLAVAGLLALPLFSAAAVVPIPVDTSLETGTGPGNWDNGVYVQPTYTPGVSRGDWTVVSCLIHIQTTADGAGEVMEATAGATSVNAPVNAIYGYGADATTIIAGRATFNVDPGVTLTTTNTDGPVAGTCPGGVIN
jgi:hypothetical protein